MKFALGLSNKQVVIYENNETLNCNKITVKNKKEALKIIKTLNNYFYIEDSWRS